MEIKTTQVDIFFSTDELVKAAENGLNLYCPVSANGEILHQECYWASQPKNSQDLDLECGASGAFAFDETDEDCLSQPTHYATIDLPATASEYLSMRSVEDFERHVSVLVKNGCDSTEALAIATPHATGFPVIKAK